MAEMLSWPEIGGVAEVMNMRGVIDGDPRMEAIVDAGLASGKLVCGHARGLRGRISKRSRPRASLGSRTRLGRGPDGKARAGLAIELRGSHDHLLPEFVETLNALGHLPQTVTLCTDDVFPDDLQGAAVSMMWSVGSSAMACAPNGR